MRSVSSSCSWAPVFAAALLFLLRGHPGAGMCIDNQKLAQRLPDQRDRRLGRTHRRDQGSRESAPAAVGTQKDVIEQLQSNRSQMVHLFDELVSTIPEGVRLTGQAGWRITLEGLSQSNARVSAYMRNIEASGWMTNPDLSQDQSDDKTLPYAFNLSLTLRRPNWTTQQPATRCCPEQAVTAHGPGSAASPSSTPAPAPAAAPAPGSGRSRPKRGATP